MSEDMIRLVKKYTKVMDETEEIDSTMDAFLSKPVKTELELATYIHVHGEVMNKSVIRSSVLGMLYKPGEVTFDISETGMRNLIRMNNYTCERCGTPIFFEKKYYYELCEECYDHFYHEEDKLHNTEDKLQFGTNITEELDDEIIAMLYNK